LRRELKEFRSLCLAPCSAKNNGKHLPDQLVRSAVTACPTGRVGNCARRHRRLASRGERGFEGAHIQCVHWIYDPVILKEWLPPSLAMADACDRGGSTEIETPPYIGR